MYDVVITGAGPAGSTCARRCAQLGLNTLLIDKDLFPRVKPCGGAVSEQALSLLDFSLPPSIIERECFGGHVHLGHHLIETAKKNRLAVLVSREKFDAFLAEKAVEAGARFVQGEPIVNLSLQKDRVEISTGKAAYAGRYVVGADGANSMTARQIRPAFSRDEIAAALVSRVTAGNKEIDERLGGHLELYFGVAPLGYGWVFPHDGYYSVGIMGEASRINQPQKVFTDFSRSVGLNTVRPRGHTIPLGGIRRKITGERILLVGDAAGFADPFHGEGIVHAIHSGRLAAEALAAGTGHRVHTAERLYEEACEQTIRKNLSVALWMAKMLERYPEIFVSIFSPRKKALDRYLDIPAGRSDYLRFRRWLLPRLPGYLLMHALGKR